MRRLVNNFLFGMVSEMMLGRLDSEVYGNSCSLLRNFKVHRQGGISRRPPLKKLKELSGYARLIRFNVDNSQVYGVLLGAGKIAIYDYVNNTLYDSHDGLALPISEDLQHSWSTITAAQCADVRFAQYYNDLYLVHPNFPLMRIRKGAGFIISIPQVIVNQDVAEYSIDCDFTVSNPQNGTVTFTFNGEYCSFAVTSSTTEADIYNNITAHEWTGYTVENKTTYLRFTADTQMDRLKEADFTDTATYNLVAPTGITCAWSIHKLDDQAEMGLAYAEDDFPPSYLNQVHEGVAHFACYIKVVAEKLYLLVNGNPSLVYASRPYSATQIVYPKRSNDSILDFIEFEIVATTRNVVKPESEIEISVLKDSDGEVVFESTSRDQYLWIPPTDEDVSTKGALENWRNGYKLNGEFVENSKHELKVIYDTTDTKKVVKLQKATTSPDTLVDYVELSEEYFKTQDSKVDMNKMLWDTDHYTSEKYMYKTQQDNYYGITPDTDGTYGIKSIYFKSQDVIVENKRYFKLQNSSYVYVTAPVQEDLGLYYEIRFEFTNLTEKPVYEYGEVYILSESGDVLVTSKLYNGAIKYMALDDEIEVSAIPYYTYKSVSESDLLEEETQLDMVGTASTAMEFQLASGRNDRLTWMELGDYLMIGTESDEYRIESSANAQNVKPVNYSSFGSTTGLCTKIGPDIIFVQRGNGLRLLYKDYYGLQNVELSLINPDITQGKVCEITGVVTPDPTVFVLMGDGRIVSLCVDRTNGVQAFAEWTFTDTPISMCDLQHDGEQKLVVLMSCDDGQYLAEFDNTERLHFSDCGYGYVLTADTSIVVGKTYYEKDGDEYTAVTPTSNPKTEGLYEYSLNNHLIPYTSTMTANPFDAVMQDGSVTIGDAKNVSKMIFRCVRTGHITTWYTNNPKDRTTTRVPICCNSSGVYDGLPADHAVNVNGGTTRDLMITVESVGDEPITLLALAYDVRINRNV